MKAEEKRCFYALDVDINTSPENITRNYSLAKAFLEPEGYEVICGPDLKILPRKLLHPPLKYIIMVVYIPSIAIFEKHYDTIRALTPKLPFIVLLDGQTDRSVQVSMLMMKGSLDTNQEDDSPEWMDGFVQFLYAVGTAFTMTPSPSRMDVVHIVNSNMRHLELFDLVKRSNKSEEINLFNTDFQNLNKKISFEITTSTCAGFEYTMSTVQEILKEFIGASCTIEVKQNLPYHEFRIEYSTENINGGMFATWLANVLNVEKKITSACVEYIGEAIYTITVPANDINKFLSVIHSEKDSLCPITDDSIVTSSIPIEISFISQLFRYDVTGNIAQFAELELMMRHGAEEKTTGLRIEEIYIPVTQTKKHTLSTNVKTECLLESPPCSSINTDDCINVTNTLDKNETQANHRRLHSPHATVGVYQWAEQRISHNEFEDTSGSPEAPPANAPPPLQLNSGRKELFPKETCTVSHRGKGCKGVLSPTMEYDMSSDLYVPAVPNTVSVHNTDFFSTPFRDNGEDMVNNKTDGLGLNVSQSNEGVVSKELGVTPTTRLFHRTNEQSNISSNLDNNCISPSDASDYQASFFSTIPPEPTLVSSTFDRLSVLRGVNESHFISHLTLAESNQNKVKTVSDSTLYRTPQRVGVMSPSVTPTECNDDGVSEETGLLSPTGATMLIKHTEEQSQHLPYQSISSPTSNSALLSVLPLGLEDIIKVALERQQRVHEEKIEALCQDLRKEMDTKLEEIHNKLQVALDMNVKFLKIVEESMENRISLLEQKIGVNDSRTNNIEAIAFKTSRQLEDIDKKQSNCCQEIIEFRRQLDQQSVQLSDVNDIIQQINSENKNNNRTDTVQLPVVEPLSRVEIENIAKEAAAEKAQHAFVHHTISLQEKMKSSLLLAIKCDLEQGLNNRILVSEANITEKIVKLSDSVAHNDKVEKELKEIRDYQDASFEKVVACFTHRLKGVEETLKGVQSLSSAADLSPAFGSRTPSTNISYYSRRGSMSDIISSDNNVNGLLSPRHEEVELLKSYCSRNASDLKDVGTRIRQIEVAQAEVSNALSIEDQNLRAIQELDHRLLKIECRVIK